jgi:iron complex outermembrane receptor protein
VFTSFDFTSNIENVHYAAFGQLTWNITEQLSLIGGLRYQYEKQDARGNRPGNALFPGDLDLIPTTPNTPFPPNVNPLSPLRPSQGSASVDDTALTGRAGVQYRFSERAQVYATYTRGYKGRAFDTEITSEFTALVPLRPETVDAYEVGTRFYTADRRLNVSAALFDPNIRTCRSRASIATRPPSDPSTPATRRFKALRSNSAFVRAGA